MDSGSDRLIPLLPELTHHLSSIHGISWKWQYHTDGWYQLFCAGQLNMLSLQHLWLCICRDGHTIFLSVHMDHVLSQNQLVCTAVYLPHADLASPCWVNCMCPPQMEQTLAQYLSHGLLHLEHNTLGPTCSIWSCQQVPPTVACGSPCLCAIAVCMETRTRVLS